MRQPLGGVAAISAGAHVRVAASADGAGAAQAALKHVGGGTMIETEVGDDGTAYEVDIRRVDGSQVEVELNHNLDVIATEPDDAGHSDVDDVDDIADDD